MSLSRWIRFVESGLLAVGLISAAIAAPTLQEAAGSGDIKLLQQLANGADVNAVDADGVPITGSSATMSVGSGRISGLVMVRDELAVSYQSQLDEVARGLKKLMREELAERVETAFDEEYMWPLGFALAFFGLDIAISESPVRRKKRGKNGR